MMLLYFAAVPFDTNVRFQALPAPVTAKPGNLATNNSGWVNL